MAKECGTEATFDDAIEYVKAVKEVFLDERETYQCFLDVLMDARHKRIDTKDVVDRVKKILKGHNDLLLRFNIFLPKEYEITLPVECEYSPMEDDQNVRRTCDKPTFEDALEYIGAVKEAFRDDMENYHCFLHVLKDYRHNRIDTKGVVDKVKKILKGHIDLLLRFNIFLPKPYEITLPVDCEYSPMEDDQNVRRTYDEHEEATESFNKNKQPSCQSNMKSHFQWIVNILLRRMNNLLTKCMK